MSKIRNEHPDISSQFDTSENHEWSTTIHESIRNVRFSDKEIEQFSDLLGEEVTSTPTGELVVQNGKLLRELPLVRQTMLEFARSHIAVLDQQIDLFEARRRKERIAINEEVPQNLLNENLYERPGSDNLSDYTPEKMAAKATDDKITHDQWLDRKGHAPRKHPKDLLKPELRKSLEEVSRIAANPLVANRMREYYSNVSHDDSELQNLRDQRAAWVEMKADLLS